MARTEPVLCDRECPVEPAAGISQIAGLEVEQRQAPQILDELRMPAADDALIDAEAAYQIGPSLIRLAGLRERLSE